MPIRFKPTPSPTGTANRVAIYDPISGVLTESTTTNDELALLTGLTGDILTTTNSKTVSGKTFNQDIVADNNNEHDLGTNAVKWKDAYLQGQLTAGSISTTGNATIGGDLTVNGTTTTVNTATLEVEDPNITINNGGNDATSEGAGLTVERTGTNGSLIYADASASKWRAGPAGTEDDIVTRTISQTLTNKTIVAANNTITTAAAGNLAATELNAALAELDSDITTVSNSVAAKWSKTGDSGTTAGTNFVGTTDAQDLVIKRNSIEIARATADGWQAANLQGSSSSGGDLTIRSTSNATPGDVIIGDRASEQVIIGPTGSVTTKNYSAHVLTTNANSLANALVIQENSSNVPTTIASAGPQSFIFAPKDAGGTSTIVTRLSGGDAGQWYAVRASDGTLLGTMNYGLAWGITNANTGIVPFRVSGSTGQTADLQQWSNLNAYGNTVASVGSGGQFRGAAGTVSLPGFAFQGDTNNGWWAPAADTQAWSLAGAEAMRLDSTGLGIGGAASAKLQVTNTAAATVATIVKGATSQSADLQQWQNSAGSTLAKIDSAGNATAVALTTSGTNTFSALSTGIAHLNASGVMSSSAIVNADVDAAAAIARSKIAAGTADHVVINDGSGNLSSEAALAISRGGTGQTTQTAAFDALAPTTTKGDLIVSNGTDNVRLAVGTNNYVLTADSAQATGVKWAVATGVTTDWTDSGLTTSDFTGFGTVTSINLRYRIIGKSMAIKGVFTCGTNTATEGRMNLPASALTGTSLPTLSKVGSMTSGVAQSGNELHVLAEANKGYLTFGYTSGSVGGLNKQNPNAFLDASSVLAVDIEVEIQ